MAIRRPWYTSTDLIEAVKRKCSIPISQQTVTEDELLLFANEEMFLAQVPSILQYHEEYLVYTEEVPLETNVSRYDLPSRAIGMKLRDLFYQDTDGNMFEMTNVGLSNSDIYQNNGQGYQTPRHFYVEGDEIVVLPRINGSVPGKLIMKYFLRPNSLVLNERAAICTKFIKQITVRNSLLVGGDTLTIDGIPLVIGVDFVSGVNSIATAANLAGAISAKTEFEGTVNGNVAACLFTSRTFDITSNSPGLIISNQLGIGADFVPEHFLSGTVVDFLQTDGGHRTYKFDVKIPLNGAGTDSVFFAESDVPAKFDIGDYICEQGECIIPQIPSDLHNLLAERTCARVLESIGDREGLASTNAKISELEQRQSTLIDNRVEGATKLAFNRHSSLRSGKKRR